MELVRSRDDLDERLLSLTFDDGPGDGTEAILDVLGQHGARATFFVLGRAVEGREAVVRRAAAEGHELGNHSWSHARPEQLADGELHDELVRTSQVIEACSGVAPRLARPPYGAGRERFASVAAGLGLTTVLWSIDTGDWEEPPAPVIVERSLLGARPGAIILLHEGIGRRPTVHALADLLPTLAAGGYRCVTVSELLAA